ncbi:GNAT family N-acetyltransferase [Pararhodobacter zhoushanensis]|uniref:GNAT family N-acetyltransferase n=1 Tax=Pararhodobacter zhoushanensis TaxID=2479545 RepID=UPI000F8ED4CF|nr:GNAT family N-acetyltransferase [Pararhodobacter zhoushanensis]
MFIPDLAPDLTFPRLDPTQANRDFAFAVKRAAMEPHIIKKWDWDEAHQRQIHAEHFAEKPFFAITLKGERIGTVSMQSQVSYVRFGEFYLQPEHQRHGIGARVLEHCLSIADEMDVPVRLEYLRWSPVGSLYTRHGFIEAGRSDLNIFLQRPAKSVRESA